MLGPCLVYPPRLPSAPVIPSRLPLLSTSLPDATAGTPTPAALKKARRGSCFRTAGWLRPRVVPAHSPASIAVAGHKSSPLTNATAPSTPPTPPPADYYYLLQYERYVLLTAAATVPPARRRRLSSLVSHPLLPLRYSSHAPHHSSSCVCVCVCDAANTGL